MKKIKKIFAIVLLAGLLSSVFAGTALPAVKDGWVKEGNSWYYYDNGWYEIGWKKISGYWYYFDYSNGKMKTGWFKDYDDNWYYLGSSGKMQTGWQYISGNWYYLKKNGVMAIGTVKINGKDYDFSSKGIWIKKTLKNKNGGKVLLNNSLVKITYLGTQEEYGSIELRLKIQNKSKRKIVVTTEETSINNKMVHGYLYSRLPVRKQETTELEFYNSYLRKASIKDISNIKKVEITFHIYDANTYDTIMDRTAVLYRR